MMKLVFIALALSGGGYFLYNMTGLATSYGSFSV